MRVRADELRVGDQVLFDDGQDPVEVTHVVLYRDGERQLVQLEFDHTTTAFGVAPEAGYSIEAR